MIGPAGVRNELAEEPDVGLDADVLGLNAVIDCETPSARMNCSRSSMLVRPLAMCARCKDNRKDHSRIYINLKESNEWKEKKTKS